MILRPKRGPWTCDDTQKKKKKDSAGIEEATIIDETHNHKEDFLDSTCIFSGSKKIIISKNFKGGDVVTVFGGTELDFSQADMTKPVTLEITTIFGGTKLIIPSNWEIKSEAVMIFGGIEDKRRMQTITGEPEKTLILRGTVLFGGIEIKSY
jgi:predicted membrane protein